YSRLKYLFASGTLVIFRLAASYFNKRFDLNAAAYRFTASVRYSASEKLPGYWLPVFTALTNRDNAFDARCSSFPVSVFAVFSIFLPDIICGSCTLKPANIFPLSPTNIIPSSGNSLPSLVNSSGIGGRIPPSYQYKSTGPR